MPLKHDQKDYFNPLDYTLKTFPFAYSRKKLAKSRHFFFVIEKKLLKLVNPPSTLDGKGLAIVDKKDCMIKKRY